MSSFREFGEFTIYFRLSSAAAKPMTVASLRKEKPQPNSLRCGVGSSGRALARFPGAFHLDTHGMGRNPPVTSMNGGNQHIDGCRADNFRVLVDATHVW